MNYALKSDGRDNRTEFSLAAIETILKSFYVDDLLKSVSELNINSVKANDFAVKDGIAWNFNPPALPHMGGVWERIVRTVKRVLYSMIKKTVFTDFQFITIFAEIKNIINNRPLTNVSDDFDDLEVLAPHHFLLGIDKMKISPNMKISIVVNDGKSAGNNKAVSGTMAIEYFPNLQTRKKWQTGLEKVKPRNKWPLGRVVEVYPAVDRVI